MRFPLFLAALLLLAAPAEAQRTSARWVSDSTGTPVAAESASNVGIGSTSRASCACRANSRCSGGTAKRRS